MASAPDLLEASGQNLQREASPKARSSTYKFTPHLGLDEVRPELRDLAYEIRTQFLPFLIHRRKLLARAVDPTSRSGRLISDTYRRSFRPPSDTAHYDAAHRAWSLNFGSFFPLLDLDFFSFEVDYLDQDLPPEPLPPALPSPASELNG